MPHWLIKAALQRGISFLPRSHKWNELFQTHVTKSIELDERRFEQRVAFCQRHFDHFLQGRARRIETFNALEVGTGWYPIIPVGLFLCGATEVWTYDISPLVIAERLQRMLRLFEAYARNGTLGKILPSAIPERVRKIQELSELSFQAAPDVVLEKMNIHVRVKDAQQTELPDRSVDLFVSSGVLEYIPRAVLAGILAEFQRVGTAGAVMSHYLNLVDQYSYFDPSITAFNFLKFTDGRWKLFNSPITWQNRLRISDYREMFAAADFEIFKEENVSGSADDLRKIQIAPEFRRYKEADLLVVLSWIAAKSVQQIAKVK